jgi:F-type H+-transporting ATPase subunit b
MTGNTERIPLAESNFLVPNGTFLVELVAFAIIVYILGKFVIPPINRAMTARQEAIREQFSELEEAKEKAAATENEYRDQLVEARHEAAKIREQAREEGAQIITEMRAKAQAESERILQTAHLQVEAERRQVIAQLRAEVGTMATTLAERIVGESLEDDERRERTVARFITSLEQSDPVDSSGAR